MTRSQTLRPIWLFVALSAFILSLAGSQSSKAVFIERDGTRALRVLFVGNSLTYSNDLPAIVEALAKATNQRMFAYLSIAIPDFSLEDHWNKKKDALEAIKKRHWDFVVLQQGPSASPEGRALLLEYGRRFAEVIRKRGGRPALYSVWPSRTRIQDFRGVSESYRQAAEAVDGVLFPVGDAWLNAWKVNPTIGLYSADGFHPSVAASYLAGLVIYEKLYNRSPVGLPSRLKLSTGERIEIATDQALLLQHAAEEANKSYGRR
jgi:hypothetical protein